MITNEQTRTASDHSRISMVLLVLGIVLIASNLRTSITSVGPLIKEISEDTGLSNTLAGMLTTLPLLAFALLSIPAPKIARRFGMEHTLFGSLVVLTAGILVRSLPSVAAVFIGTAMLGLAIAIGNVLLPSLIKRDFPNGVGLMTGVYSMSMNIWGAIASGLSVPLSQGLGLGWRGALECWAILSSIAIIVWLPQLKTNPQFFKSIESTVGSLWRSKLAWQVTLFMGLQSLSFFSTIAWMPEIFVEKGISVTSAGWLLSLMQFITLPVTFFVPLLAGRLPNQRSLVGAIMLFYFAGYAGLLGGSTNLLTLWIILLGIAQGAGISMALALIGLRSSNSLQAAELSGMAQSIGYLLAASGPILFGFLHDLTHNWTVSLLVLFAASIIQLIVGLGAGRNAYVTTASRSESA